MFLCLAKFAERPGVVPSIGERVPTRVTQHVRIHWQDEAGPLTIRFISRLTASGAWGRCAQSQRRGADYLKPAPNNYLRRWPVLTRVNSSSADADDLTLIEPIQLTLA